MRIYSYLRVSSRGQIDGDGFPRQRQAITDFCALHKLDHVGEFVEKGVPGKTECLDRPAFTDMLDCIKNRRDRGCETVDAIVIERMDRLARDLIISEMLLSELRKRNIKIYSSDQGLIDIASDETDPTQKLIRQVIAAVAEFEKSTLVRKLRVARERSVAAGGTNGGTLKYGELAGELQVRNFILAARAAGGSLRQITRKLREEGILSRAGTCFHLSTVAKIIKRESNVGPTNNNQAEHAAGGCEGATACASVQ